MSDAIVWDRPRADLVAALAAELEVRHGSVEHWAEVIVTNLFGPEPPTTTTLSTTNEGAP